MRNLILLVLVAATILPAFAVERITVKALEQKLAAATAAQRSDGDKTLQIGEDSELLQQLRLDPLMASQIDSLELSERLTGVTLERITAKYDVGPETQRALEQLADRSALNDPPVGEIPDIPAPDRSSQKRMVGKAYSYVLQVLSHLPDFFATRTTARFEDASLSLGGRDLPTRSGLHLVGTSRREITFRDGKEIINPMQDAHLAQKPRPEAGLESRGEFGPEAGIILLDIGKGTLAFDHWEQTSAGLAAVFRYSVPGSESHYEVNYSCNGNASLHKSPGYHGTLGIDPASGAILRITLEADWKDDDPISHIASVIEYGTVVLGDRRHICPLRSLAFMVEEASACVQHGRKQKVSQSVTMLNRTNFTEYHRLGTTIRIVQDEAAMDAPNAGATDTSAPLQNAPSAGAQQAEAATVVRTGQGQSAPESATPRK